MNCPYDNAVLEFQWDMLSEPGKWLECPSCKRKFYEGDGGVKDEFNRQVL